MNSKTQLYSAQTIGNIEPIEYMIPYPGTQAIIEGQIIKYGDKSIFSDYNLKNIEFYELIQKMANWLTEQGINPKDNVVIEENSSLHSLLLLYSLWHMGAKGVFLENSNVKINKKLNAKRINFEIDFQKTLMSYPSVFIPKYKALLDETAIIMITGAKSILLSHYSLLVNANSIQKALDLRSGMNFYCDLKANSTFWVVICAILPIYTMCPFTKKDPHYTFTYDEISQKQGYRLRKDLENIENFRVNDIALCIENSAVLAVKNNPIHLTDFKVKENELWIKGHSLMSGYLEEELMSFKDNYLIINNL
jgi:acyl-CoA synthetase (AMP-forming)/AMP-acid ligase II